MEDEKVLMSVTTTGEGTGVSVTCNSAEEMFYLCLSLIKTIESYPMMKAVFNYLKDELKNDPEFSKNVDRASTSSRDFNDILKNLK